MRPAPRGETTGDGDVVRRRWLPIDADPVRPAGISATDAEHAAALARVDRIAEDLGNEGWPVPVKLDTGNGGWLLYPIDLPAADGGLVAAVLATLSARYSDDAVRIDTSVHNPARISRLAGTRTPIVRNRFYGARHD